MTPYSTALTVGLVLIASASAEAQPITAQSMPRGDASGTIGWFNADKSGLHNYNDWYNRSVWGGGTVGWYWTEHLKTEIEAGATSRVSFHVYRSDFVDGRQIQGESTFHFGTRRIAFGQHYQFGRNAWFHPYVGGGVDLRWERVEQEDGPHTVFDSTLRRTTEVLPPAVHAARTEFSPRPFATFGGKWYVTPRAFLRSDLRMVFRNGVDEVMLRFGVGADF
jgi:hypothetical protein